MNIINENIFSNEELFITISLEFLKEFKLTHFRNQVDLKFLLSIFREEQLRDHATISSFKNRIKSRMRQYYISQYNLILNNK